MAVRAGGRQSARLKRLRRRLSLLANPLPEGADFAWSMGTPGIDRLLPADTLSARRLHEVVPSAHDDSVAAAGFASALITRLRQAAGSGDVLWCRRKTAYREWGTLYGPGLAVFGLEPAQLTEVRVRRDRDVLWAMEEGLKSRAVLAVLGEVADLDLTAGRRLALAAQSGETTPFLLRPGGRQGIGVAWTRWQIATLPSDAGGRGAARWRVELARARNGVPPQSWTLEWQHETNCFLVAAEVAGRALAPGEFRLRHA